MLPVLVILRAVMVRTLFASHGLITVWRLAEVTKNPYFWFIATALLGLAAETAFTIRKKRGHDWKWFCPSVMFYLLCVVPAIWFLELHELDKRLFLKGNFSLMTRISSIHTLHNDTVITDRLNSALTNLGLDLTIPLISGLSSDQWVRTLEQILLLILIIGRWMLPKGKLSHSQLSQLLLVYIGTASDIVELFEAFKEEVVQYNPILCMVILSIWSLSLLQFTMVLTATKARKDKAGLIPSRPLADDDEDDETSHRKSTRGLPAYQANQHQFVCCTPDVYGVIISICMQDVPFLVLRLLLIFKYGVLSYTNMFFTCKNTLICSLLLYRVIVVQIERRRQAMRRFRHWASVYHASRGGSDAASSSVVRLVTMAKSASSIASSATAVLRRSQSSGPPQQQQDQPPSYVVLPRYDTTQELLANAENGLTTDNTFTASTPAAAAVANPMATEKEKEAMIETMVNEAMKYNRSMSVEYKQLHLDNSPAVVNYTIKKHRHRRHLQQQQQQQEQRQNDTQAEDNEKSLVEEDLKNDVSNGCHDDNLGQPDISDKNVSASNFI